jgi:CheY-like chemotaxis protein
MQEGTLDPGNISSVSRKRKMVRQDSTESNNSTYLPEDLHMFRSTTQGVKIQDDFSRGAGCLAERTCLATVGKKANPKISPSIIKLKDLATAVLENACIHPDIELDLELKAGGPLYIESDVQSLQISLRYIVEHLAEVEQDDVERTITMTIEHSSQDCVFTIVISNNFTCSPPFVQTNTILSRNTESLVFQASATHTEFELDQKCKIFFPTGGKIYSVCGLLKKLNGTLRYFSSPEAATFILSVPQTLNSTERIVFTKTEAPPNRFDRLTKRCLPLSLDHEKVTPISLTRPTEGSSSSLHPEKDTILTSIHRSNEVLPSSIIESKDFPSNSLKQTSDILSNSLNPPKETSSLSLKESTVISSKSKDDREKDTSSSFLAPSSTVIQTSPLVLVVEDTAMCAKLLCTILRQCKCATKWVENGQEALDELRGSSEHYNLVLMDLRMPVMDGLTATRIIKAEMKMKIPVVALTGESGSQIKEDCKEIGFDDFFNKPLKKAQLIKLVEVHTGYNYESAKS